MAHAQFTMGQQRLDPQTDRLACRLELGGLLVGSLAAQELRSLEIEGTRVTREEVLFKGVGRIRDVVVGPDGFVYLAMHGPDRIARLVPADGVAPRTARKH